MAPGPVGGTFTPGQVLPVPPMAGTPPNGIPGGTLYIGTNGQTGTKASLSSAGGTVGTGIPGGTYPSVIVAGPSNNLPPGGVIVGGGVGGTVTPGTGGAIAPGTGGTMSNGGVASPNSVIVGGGQ